MTGQEKAIVAAFTLFLLALVAAVVVGAVRRRRGVPPPPAPVRFVSHWKMMAMLALAAFGILSAILLPIIARVVSE
jgi:hypothetical protein